MLYGLTVLGLSTAVMGSVIGVGGIGALLGVFAARRLPTVLGLGPTLVVSLFGYALATLFIPLAGSAWAPAGWTVSLLVVHQLFSDGCLMVFNVHAISLRQTVLPTEVLGRVNGALAAMLGGLVPIGALIAGPLAELVGVRGALVIGLGLSVLAPVTVALSPVARMSSAPDM
jgi:hypothetical protein